MSRGQRFSRLEPDTKEPSNQADMRYYNKFKDASEEEIRHFVAATDSKSNADIVAMADAFVIAKKETPKPKSKKKVEEKKDG